MTEAKEGSVVKVHYTGRLEDGTVFDTSLKREPLQFRIGDGQIIPGFEQAVIGMEPGESKTAKVLANQAYGPHDQEQVHEIDRSKFPSNVHIGQQYQIDQGERGPRVFIVIDVSAGSVTLDSNHPLAGQDLTFDIQLLELV
jgi:peptidylprolyl isomerase